jgi:8-oxo-dGTP pyrophosphatase MutT (NUDIX family)
MSPPDGSGAAPAPGAERGGFRQIGERTRLAGGFLRVVSATFVAPDGFTFEREVVRHPGAVCVVPVEDGGKDVLLVRQFRAAVGRELLELPAGKLDVAGEAPEEAARRELVEEVGKEPGTLVELGRFYNSPGFSDELTICYLAQDLRPARREAHGVEERYLSVERLCLDDLDDLVAAGALVDAKTLVGLFLARAALGSPGVAPAEGAAPPG